MSQLDVQHDVELSPYTTFGFSQRAAHFVEVHSEAELAEAVQIAQTEKWPLLALGGGSNLVFAHDYPGLIIRQLDQTISYQQNSDGKNNSNGDIDDKQDIQVTASAGVSWHTLVMDTVNRGLTGLENLSLIPGQVGAAPVQNIGAYGVELCDRFVCLRALHVPSGEWHCMNGSDCQFSYRDSHFKHHDGDYIISSVTLRLGEHLGLHTAYATLSDYLALHYPGVEPDARLVSEAVCVVRSARLPDPAKLPNAGSFFHNPITSAEHFLQLQVRFPDIVGHALADGRYKLAAGWLIDRLGYKGYRDNGVGVHEHQALVLVKYQQTDASALIQLADKIRQHVMTEYGVTLNIEPRIL
ncbi:UDP-N-acetylmuramate dehydrogenase [Granulosicoccus antarcticus]|uniref:UDP-N-acetylenolpyruvoylglucosamine reductase n=1 Tax=Granulosicoccus antarcticus IMCC3135 TaxID=1192854 RepID=A0A2Z2NT89_9GAMM|nr:UDP-N-acetylmuramate dehydrogenase [Granulosicoccus antarcticus]ASJ74529.1 UDP-N-acetylenolpyruvoylglucosamine reductase [Granulosicoccus antarcticus IMCC3135]